MSLDVVEHAVINFTLYTQHNEAQCRKTIAVQLNNFNNTKQPTFARFKQLQNFQPALNLRNQTLAVEKAGGHTLISTRLQTVTGSGAVSSAQNYRETCTACLVQYTHTIRSLSLFETRVRD